MISSLSAFMRTALLSSRLQRDQWLPPERLGELRWARLQAIVRHAYTNTAFYRERFRESGLVPDDIAGWDDLPKIPITTREDLQRPERLIARNIAPGRLRSSLTSGSTGRPTTSYFDPAAWVLSKHALKLRARWACGVRPWDRVALIQETPPKPAAPGSLYRLATYSVHAPVEEIAAELKTFSPSVLYGFPGHFVRLGQAAAGRIRPRLIFTSGEMLDPATRRAIERSFGAPVFDVYGCTEIKEIAWECPEREGYHVNADWLVVEFAPSDPGAGRPDGQVLITSLYNFGMPLLRYQVGDTGEAVAHRCRCGRGLPLIRPMFGRSADYIVLADGSTISPYSLTCAIEKVEGVAQYQITQEAIDRVEIKVVPGARFKEAGGRRRIQEALRPVLRGLAVEVRTVDRIPPEPSGKYRIVRSMTDAAGRQPAPEGSE